MDRGRRFSERSLLFLSVLGPFGALAAMISMHHKTKKKKFLLVPALLLIHLLIIAYLVHSNLWPVLSGLTII